MANWLKAQRFDKLVAAGLDSPLRRLFLFGGRPFSDPSPELVVRLRELFLPEIEAMESVLNRDLSAWKCSKPQPLAEAASASL